MWRLMDKRDTCRCGLRLRYTGRILKPFMNTIRRGEHVCPEGHYSYIYNGPEDDVVPVLSY